MTTPQPAHFAVAYTAPGQNANNAPMLNVLASHVGCRFGSMANGGQGYS